jgi:hypothetical protein
VIRAQLGLTPGADPPPDGTYLVGSMGVVTGGIYVQGTATRILLAADTVAVRQSYRITRGSTVTSIVVDPGSNTTTVTAGAATTVYSGLPNGVVYVVGGVPELRGPDRIGGLAGPALLDGQRVLLTATGDIVLQADLTVQDFERGSAVLGIYSCGGSVRIGTAAPNDLLLDAFVMAVGSASAFSVDGHAAGVARGAVHLRGGCVTSYFGAFGVFGPDGSITHGYARDFRLDDRGWEPPHYPGLAPGQPVAVAPVRRESAMRLWDPRPNPTRGALSITFSLGQSGRVRLSLFDVAGRRITDIVDGERPAGFHEVSWVATGSKGPQPRPGVYLLQLEASGQRDCVRVTMIE